MTEVRTCCTCSKEKPYTEFSMRNKDKGTRHGYCKECHKVYRRKHYLRNRQKYIDKAQRLNKVYRDRNRKYGWEYLLAHPCVDCGETNPIKLDFDHVFGKKHKQVSDMTGSAGSIDTLKKEIAKCEIRCSNCHRMRHAEENNTWAWQKFNTGV